MTDVFVSSLERGEMSQIRAQARAAIESLGMRAVMAETEPAAAADPRRTLLDRIGDCEVMILLLGAAYGEPGERGLSPTDEEFQQAVRAGVPVLVLEQHGVTRTQQQEEFVSRARAGWEQGNFTSRFEGAEDVGLKVVAALNAWRDGRTQAGGDENRLERVHELAQAGRRDRYVGPKLRVVLVPSRELDLLDAVALSNAALPEAIATAARISGLISNQYGVQIQVQERHILLQAEGGREHDPPRVLVGPDGAVLCEAPVRADGLMGGSIVEGPRVRTVFAAAAATAQEIWRQIDARDEVRDLLVITAVPNPSNKVFADAPFTGSSMRMGSMTSDSVLLAPAAPTALRRADLATETTQDRIVAEVRQAFADRDSLLLPTN